MLGACGDHCLVGDGYYGIGCNDLAFLLFPSVDSKGEACDNARMDVGHVVIQIRLADLGKGGDDVHEKGAEIDGIETFGGVIKNGVVDVIDRCRKLVVCDGEDLLVGVPCLTRGSIGGVQFFAFGCCGTSWDGWVG